MFPVTGWRTTVVHEMANVTDAAATFNSNPVNVEDMIEGAVFLHVTVVSGGSPTLDVKLQYSHDQSVWKDVGVAFAQITSLPAATDPAPKFITNFGLYVRAVCTIGGSTPKFTFSLKFVGKS